MARKKTLEELRDSNRQRQRRWREAHRWLNRERKAACYGQSQAQKKLLNPDPVSNNVTCEYDPREEYEEMEPVMRGGHGNIKSIWAADERGLSQADTGGPAAKTAEEKAVDRRLQELRERQAKGQLGGSRRGVVVPDFEL